MSYAPPPLQAHHRLTSEVHPHHVPSASGTHHAHSIERPQYEKSFIEGLVSSDFASLPGASSSQVSRQIPIFRPNNANGPLIQPSVPVVSRIPSSHFPPTPVTPTGPSPVPGSSVPPPPPGPAHYSSGQTTTSVILTHEIVNAVVASYDKNVQTRLSALESSMRGSIQHQARTNTTAIDTLNAKLAEDRTLIAKKLDDLVLDGEEKRALAMQNLNTSLGLWQTMMADTAKAAIKEAVGEAAKIMPSIDEKKVLDHVSALGRLTITLDERASTHRNAIASEINLLHSTQSQIQSQVDLIDARTKSIEKILTSAISSLASASSPLPFPVASPVSHATSSALSISPTPRHSFSSAGVTVSIATPELLASSANLVREHITECTSQTQETLAQFAKTINVARDEDHEVRSNLAKMLDNSHALQTAQMDTLLDEISFLKATIGVLDPVHTPSEESTVNTESMIGGTTEVCTSHTPITLAERMRAIEENQQVLLQYLKNTALSEEILREVSLDPNDSASTCCTDNAESYITSSSLYDMKDQTSNKLNHILRYLLANIQMKPENAEDQTGLVKEEKKPLMKAEPRKSSYRGSRLRRPSTKKSTSSSKASSMSVTQSSKQGSQAGEQAQTGNELGPESQDKLAILIATKRGDLNVSSTDSPSTIPSLSNTAIPTSATSGSLSHSYAMDTDETLPLAQSSRADMAQDDTQGDRRLSVTKVRAGALRDDELPKLAGEELLSPHYLKRYRHDDREDSPLTPLSSDSDDEYVPAGSSCRSRSSEAGPSRRKSIEKSRKGGGDYVCPRPSCGRRYKHVTNLNRHMEIQACPDLRAARMEEYLNQRREASPAPSGTNYFYPPPTKKQKLDRSKHDASAIMFFSDRKARGYRSKAQRKPGNAELSTSKDADNSSLELPGDHQIPTATPKSMASRKSTERRLVRVNSDDQSSSTRSLANGQPSTTALGSSVASLSAQPASSAFGLQDFGDITKNPDSIPLQPAASASGCTWPEKSKGDDVFGSQLIQCDKCSIHYHFRCVGVKKGDPVILLKNEPFICPPCSILPIARENVAAVSQKLDSQPPCGRPDCDWLGAKDIFVVDKILGRALSDPGEEAPYYFWLVKWAGYPPSKCRWEKADQIGDVDKLAEEFYAAAAKEGFNCHSNDLIILKEAIEGGYVIPRGGVQS